MSLAPAVAVVALSARLMAESLARAGRRVIALDAFGDADTHAACAHWLPLGRDDAIALDLARLPEVMSRLARDEGVAGWIAGSGFEGHEAVLAVQGGVPLLGNPAEVVARVRDPRGFFAALDAAGIAHPAVRFEPPAQGRGWLVKDAASAGGFGVRRLLAQPAAAVPEAVRGGTRHVARDDSGDNAGDNARPASRYWQRELAGRAVSALFLADGRHARIVGVSEQQTVAIGAHAFVFAGAIGPVELPAAQAVALQRAVTHLSAHFGLLGLCSLDTVVDAEGVQVLELNARPSASQALYDDAVEGGLMQAHVIACRERRLPAPAALPPTWPQSRWRGLRVVYAARAAQLDAAALERLQRRPACHDRPGAPQAFAAGQPVCSVQAEAADRETLIDLLQAEAAAVIQSLQTPTHEARA